MYKYLDSPRAPIVVSLLLLCHINIIETKALEKKSVSISMANPCHTNPVSNTIMTLKIEHDSPITNKQAANMDIDLVRLFETINTTATIESNNIRKRINTNSWDASYLIEPDTMEVNNDTRQNVVTKTNAFMITIDQELISLSGHLRYSSMNGKLPLLANEEELIDQMKTVEDLINSARCNLHIDNNGECIVSADFVNFDGDFASELGRAFVTIRDIQRYMTFLIELYQSTNTY